MARDRQVAARDAFRGVSDGCSDASSGQPGNMPGAGVFERGGREPPEIDEDRVKSLHGPLRDNPPAREHRRQTRRNRLVAKRIPVAPIAPDTAGQCSHRIFCPLPDGRTGPDVAAGTARDCRDHRQGASRPPPDIGGVVGEGDAGYDPKNRPSRPQAILIPVRLLRMSCVSRCATRRDPGRKPGRQGKRRTT